MEIPKTDYYFKDFAGWHQHVLHINSYIFKGYFHEKEIWWCSLGVNIGSEQDGKNASFERPVLIIKRINNDLLWILPLSTKLSNNYYRINTRNTGHESQINISQIRAVSSKRLLRKISKIDNAQFIKIILKIVLTLIMSVQNETPRS